MLKRGEQVRLQIIDAGFEGKAIARHDGLVVFIENAVPGDEIIAELTKIKKEYAEAKIISVEKLSSIRMQPRCKYFGFCGGCKWQNIEYESQLHFKQKQVVDIFERIGGFKDLNILPIVGADNIYFYRSKMEFSFSNREWTLDKLPSVEKNINNSGNVFLGLHVPNRYSSVIDIEECHLQSENSNLILNFARDFARKNKLDVYDTKRSTGYLRFLVIRESKRNQEIMVNLVTFTDEPEIMRRFSKQLIERIPKVTTIVNTINSQKAQIAFGEQTKVYVGEGHIFEKLGQYSFKISPNSFFQTNVIQAEKLYNIVKEFAEFGKDDVVFDLYSGTGSIAIYISDAVKEVVGIESVQSAIEDANVNAQLNKIMNCNFLLGDLKDRLTNDTDWLSVYPKPDVFVIDPPRSGMHPKVVEEIIKIAPAKIIYVSCNPATQARDIKLLCASKYELIKLQPIDMFPHTYHIENAALLHIR